MKKILAFIVATVLLFSSTVTAYAAESKYKGRTDFMWGVTSHDYMYASYRNMDPEEYIKATAETGAKLFRIGFNQQLDEAGLEYLDKCVKLCDEYGMDILVLMRFVTYDLEIAAFQGVDKSYFEAGAIDGIRNRWQELWYITIPMLKPQMVFSAVMSITGAFGVGPVITALCGYPSTDYAAHTIMNHLTDYGGIRFEMGYASAIAVVLFIMMISFNQFAKKFISSIGK